MINSDLDNNFNIVDKTFSMAKANIMSFFIIIPIYIIFSIIFNTVCGYEKLSPYHMVLIGILLVMGLVLHEFFHGFVWHLFCNHKWKSIKFGINIKTFSPYAHCKEVLPINQYRLGTIAPAIITGVIPIHITQTGHPTGVVFATDLSLLIPAVLLSGIMLWRRKPWGYVLSAVVMIKSVAAWRYRYAGKTRTCCNHI